jgi:hypothetical protein
VNFGDFFLSKSSFKLRIRTYIYELLVLKLKKMKSVVVVGLLLLVMPRGYENRVISQTLVGQ